MSSDCSGARRAGPARWLLGQRPAAEFEGQRLTPGSRGLSHPGGGVSRGRGIRRERVPRLSHQVAL